MTEIESLLREVRQLLDAPCQKNAQSLIAPLALRCFPASTPPLPPHPQMRGRSPLTVKNYAERLRRFEWWARSTGMTWCAA